MNLSTVLGFATSMIVFVVTVLISLPDVRYFFDLPSALLVVGGTVTVTFICYPADKIFKLLKVFVRRVFGRSKRDFAAIVGEVERLSRAYLAGKRVYEAAIPAVSDPFLKDAAEVLFWLEEDITADQLRELLEQRAETHYNRYMSEAKVFKTISKFPPAFGLLGTTLGMIALLQSLGNEDAKSTIGPSMAVALITTMYGVAISNMIITPIAENLTQQTNEDDIARRIVVEGIMLIEQKQPTNFVVEKVKSYLLPSERDATGKGSAVRRPNAA